MVHGTGMANEAVHLQQAIENCGNRARVLAVTSGKGGVGKTNIAANLAISLAALQKEVLLVDMDMSLGNLDILMNLNSRYNISHILDGRKSIEEVIHIGPEGLGVICGASGLEELAHLSEFQRQRLLRELSGLQSESDFIVIDTAAGISKTVVGFCLAADQVLVVTTPEATAMTDAYGMIKSLSSHRYGGRVSVVVNMAESASEGKKTYQQLAKVAKQFLNVHVYLAGVFLQDELLRAAVRQRKPVVLAYPKSKTTLSTVALAAKLVNDRGVLREQEGFFKKVFDWFF